MNRKEKEKRYKMKGKVFHIRINCVKPYDEQRRGTDFEVLEMDFEVLEKGEIWTCLVYPKK